MRSKSKKALNLQKDPLWFKVTGMLNQNWAMVNEKDAGRTSEAVIYFFDDLGKIFDLMSYPNAAHADYALEFNGFTPLDDEPGFRAIAGEPEFPLTLREERLRPIYSTGEYWQQPPDIENVTKRRVLTPKGLDRFIQAQNLVIDEVMSALNCINFTRFSIRGRKRTHWMWFIFPQIYGLGHSSIANKYGLANLDEAQAFLMHPLLGPRLRKCFQLVIKHSERNSEEIFGHIDAMKFRSCATLFQEVAKVEDNEFAKALNIFYKDIPDGKTLQLLYFRRNA